LRSAVITRDVDAAVGRPAESSRGRTDGLRRVTRRDGSGSSRVDGSGTDSPSVGPRSVALSWAAISRVMCHLLPLSVAWYPYGHRATVRRGRARSGSVRRTDTD